MGKSKKMLLGGLIALSLLLILAIVLGSLALPQNLSVLNGEDGNLIKEGKTIAQANNSGSFSIALNNKTLFEDAFAEYSYNGKKIKSIDYKSREIISSDVNDKLGKGKKVVIHHFEEDKKLPDFNIIISVYESGCVTALAEVISPNQIAIDNISPIVIDNGKIDMRVADHFLEVPFDNDAWDTYDVKTLLFGGSSSEVGCFFSDKNGNGFVVGALTHENWKNGIWHKSVAGQVSEIKVTSGVKTQYDQAAHGAVKGNQVRSELFYLAFNDDWQKAMSEYAKTNTLFAPKRDSNLQGVPVGFNSWGVIQSSINYDKAIKVSDNIKANYQTAMENAGEKVFINLDSYWREGFSDAQLKDFVEHCKANGQEAGIYWCPFVCWNQADELATTKVEGSDNVYYKDVILKKPNGEMYNNKVDGCFPLDLTHPAVLKRMEIYINNFVEWGFKYVKLDFMSHGAMEGLHYDKNITTGTQAYRLGMKKITELAGDDMFINLSIAPIFPYEFANGRRMACDSFYKIKDTKYTLNAVTYGFWTEEFYDYPDPDHIVLWGKDGGAEFNEAQSRLLSGVIGGTSMLFGDDFSDLSNAQMKERLKLINNNELMKVASFHKSFKPILYGKYTKAANVFVLEMNDKTYYAVFNYSKNKDTFNIAINGKYTAKELMRGADLGNSFNGIGKLVVNLEGKQCALFEITKY